MRDFYPFVEEHNQDDRELVLQPARIAIYDDVAAAPRVVVIEADTVREYLEQVTSSVTKLSHDAGGTIPFMVIREIVENFIHAGFESPTITILDEGNTLRFSDKGPGIQEKSRALEYGTSSATEEMKLYIRGVGSGLPYAQQYMADHGGSLTIEDNISGGCVVTISTRPSQDAREISRSQQVDENTATNWQNTQPFEQQVYPTYAMSQSTQELSGYPYQPASVQAVFPVQHPQVLPNGMSFAPQNPYAAGTHHPTYNPYVTTPQQGAQGFYQHNQYAQGYIQAPNVSGIPTENQQGGYTQETSGYTPQTTYPSSEVDGGVHVNSPYTTPVPLTTNQTAQSMHISPIHSRQEHVHHTMAGASYDTLTNTPAQNVASVVSPHTTMRPALFDDVRYQEVFELFAHTSAVGPQDLVLNYGKSAPTWSRILKELTSQGVIIKRGQKYYLTNLGKSYLFSH